MSKQKPEPARTAPPAIVLYGLDHLGKPRAGRFSKAEADLAIKAAEQLELKVLALESTELLEMAASLPPGRVYASGKGIVPNVRQRVFDRLTELTALATAAHDLVGTGNASSRDNAACGKDEAVAPGAVAVAHGLPKSWDAIEVDQLVLAHESIDHGWWEAIVLRKEDDLLTLRWRDNPKPKKFNRHRTTRDCQNFCVRRLSVMSSGSAR